MFFFFTNAGSRTIRVSERLLLREEPLSQTPYIYSGLPYLFRATFARTPDGKVYIANGLNRMVKWDGISPQAESVGVTAPTAAPVIASTGMGDISGRYTAYVRFVDADGNVSNLSPVSNEITPTDVSQINYTSVPVPTEAKVTKRQILRNTNGQAAVYYVDVETTDLTQTSFSSTLTDDTLRNQEAVPLFDIQDRNIANLHGLPPNDKPIVVFYNNRLFAIGDVSYDEGHVEVTNGSATVQGIGTQFTSTLADRLLYVAGEDEIYTIDSVSEANQTLTLDRNYRGDTDAFAVYAIRSTPATRTLIYWTEPGQYDSWPAINSIEISSSDDLEDEITGVVVTQSFVYILQRRHIYRLTYLLDPLVDGGVFLAARRGCVNDRCWVNVDGFTYMLDDRGIYRFAGGDNVEDLSQPIQDIFWTDKQSGPIRINWKAAKWFHALHDRNDCTIRWFMALSGERYPRHALCFNYQNPQWWIEEYPWPIPASDHIKEADPHPVVSGHPGGFYAVGIGTLDVTDWKDGDTRGEVVSATLTSLTTSGLTFPASGMVNGTIAIVSGRGKGQLRIIASVSGQTIRITQPWLTVPDTTSVFQVGAIPWKWRSPWFNWAFKESTQTRRITCEFRPTKTDNQFDLRVFRNYADDPENHKINWPRTPKENSGVTITKDDPDAEFDLTQSKGFSQLRLDGWKDFDEWNHDIVAIELRGVGGKDPVQIYEIAVEGAN